jgi:hypothetical protein
MEAEPWLGVLLPGSTHVELRFPIRPGDDRRIVGALGAEPLHADVRQVWFLETDDHAWSRLGVTVGALRIPRSRADVVVGVALERHRHAVTGFVHLRDVDVDVEIDQQGPVPWCVLTGQVTEARLRGLLNGSLVLAEVLTPAQTTLLDACTRAATSRRAHRVLPPVHVLTRSYLPRGYSRRLAAETWFLPDGARRLSLVTRCRPSSAAEVTDATRRFLDARGIRLDTETARTATVSALLAGSRPGGRS